MSSNNPITWSQIKDLTPIIGLLIVAISSYVAVMIRISIMDERIKNSQEQIGRVVDLYQKLADKNTEQDLRLQSIDTRLSIQK